jgi:signal transduction histidine kinase/Flp pilus assembly protein TadD
MHIKSGLLLLLILPCLAKAQDNKPMLDSLEKLVLFQKDSALIQTYNELTWQYRLVDREKAISYGNKALEQGKAINYLKGVAQAYNDLGIIFYDIENYDTAIYLYKQAMNIRKILGDELGIAKLYNKIGIIYQKMGKFDLAQEQQLKALELFRKYNNDIGISYSLNNLGIINQNMGRYDQAIRYQEESIAIKEKINDQLGLAGSYVNVGNIYLIKEDYNKAKAYYRKAVEMCRSVGDKEYLSNALNNIGRLFVKAKQYDSAINPVKESYLLRKELNDSKGMASCLNNLGDIYTELKHYDSAESVLKNALQLGKSAVNCQTEINNIYLSLAKLYEAKGNYAQALEMYKLYASTKDSIYTDQLGQRFAELETKYKTLEEQKKNQDLQFEITRKNYWMIGGVSLFVLISLLAFSNYRRYKLRQEARLQAEVIKQQDMATKAILEAEEKERQRIARDLHDGVGQTMSAASMNLSAIQSHLPFLNESDKLSFDKIIALVDESCKEVRAVSHNMMPNTLLKAGLAGALREFIDKIDSDIIKINLHTEGLNERLHSDVEIVLYSVIQECVNNVIKHAGANHLDISLIKDKDGISVTIEDNGKGFNINEKEKFQGIGLKNIVTRVEYLKGTVDFDSSPGKGTLIAIHIPN